MKSKTFVLNTIGMIVLAVSVIFKMTGITFLNNTLIIVSLCLFSILTWLLNNVNQLIKSLISVFYISSIFILIPNWPGSKWMIGFFFLSTFLLCFVLLWFIYQKRFNVLGVHKNLFINIILVVIMIICFHVVNFKCQ